MLHTMDFLTSSMKHTVEVWQWDQGWGRESEYSSRMSRADLRLAYTTYRGIDCVQGGIMIWGSGLNHVTCADQRNAPQSRRAQFIDCRRPPRSWNTCSHTCFIRLQTSVPLQLRRMDIARPLTRQCECLRTQVRSSATSTNPIVVIPKPELFKPRPCCFRATYTLIHSRLAPAGKPKPHSDRCGKSLSLYLSWMLSLLPLVSSSTSWPIDKCPQMMAV